MKTMTKVGKSVLWLSLPLLVLATLAGPALASNVEFQMWVEPAGGGAAYTAAELKTLAPGDYDLVVQARVTNNLTANRFITGAAGAKKAYDIYGCLQNWSFNLVDSTGTGLGSALNFADDGFGSWGTTPGPKANYPSVAVNGLDTGGLDVNCVGASVGISAAGLAIYGTTNNGKYGGYGIEIVGASVTTGLGGTQQAGPVNDARWFTLVTGTFNYAGGVTELSMNLDPGNTGRNVAANEGTNGATFKAPKLATDASTPAPTLLFGEGGGPVSHVEPALESKATDVIAALDAANTYEGRETTWHQPDRGGNGMWWDPLAYITLVAPTGVVGTGPFAFEWTLTYGTSVFKKTVAGDTTVSIADLGWPAPSAPQGGWATIGLMITDTSDLGYGVSGGTAPLFLPEPASMFVLALGAVGALIRRRRR